MVKLLKKNNLIIYYRYLIFERFIKLRYLNNNANLRFFFSQFYNKKLLQIIKYLNNNVLKNKKFNFLFFITVFRYKIYININCFEQFNLILKNKFKFNNYFIFSDKFQIIIGTQNLDLYLSLFFELEDLKNKIIDNKVSIVETSKILLKLKNYTFNFYLNDLNNKFKINLLFKAFNINLVLLKFLILFLISLFYYIVFFIQIRLYYGYIKTINKRLS